MAIHLGALTAVLILALASLSRAWGPDGHMITAQVAQSLLSSEEVSKLKSFLGGEALSDVANWADAVKGTPEWRWSAPLHFIDVPNTACNFQWERECKQIPGVAGCANVAGATLNYTQIFQTPSPAPASDAHSVALKFIVHFMGDIHQPLHVSHGADWGGNHISVVDGFSHGQHDNLHMVWDIAIIAQHEKDRGYGWQGYAANLTKQVQGAWASAAQSWSSCLSATAFDLKACLSEMAEESIEAACKFAYKNEKGEVIHSGDVLSQGYYETRAPVIDQQLAKGGVRLAALLRHALKQSHPPLAAPADFVV